MLKVDLARIGPLKARLRALDVDVRKGDLVGAGLRALERLSDAQLRKLVGEARPSKSTSTAGG